MYKEMASDLPIVENKKEEKFEVTGTFMIDYGAFMNYCYGDMGNIEIPEGSMDDVLKDIYEKKLAWQKEAGELDPTSGDEKTEELLGKIEVAKKMIEYYTENQ